jgi:hypothetical protein
MPLGMVYDDLPGLCSSRQGAESISEVGALIEQILLLPLIG